MVKGFMGKSHALMSIALLCMCMLIPVGFLKNTVWLLKDHVLFFIIGIVVASGGALLPDLDNTKSFAGSYLGPVGSICTVFMQSTSTIMWNLIHFKGDRHPSTPHRYFWHTLIAGISLTCILYFGVPSNELTIIQNIQELTFIGFLQKQAIVFVLLFVLFTAILLGSNMILNKVIKAFKLPKILTYILPVLIIVYMFFLDYNHLKILGLCIGLGYIFHCLEDFFADTGVPLLWPIPIHNQCWHRLKFFVTCKTGSLANTIIDIIALIIDIVLIILVFAWR